MSDWRPIETAPKDYGSHILVWNGEGVFKVHDYHGWCNSDDADDMPLRPEPTHWMPLPKRPEQ